MSKLKLTKDTVNNAIITSLTNVRPHPNADRMQLATVLGSTVIVAPDSEDGDKVIYFDSNLKLSAEYCHYNNLYRKPEMNCNTSVTGYFDDKCRVKATKLRGEISNGYVAPLSSLYSLQGEHSLASIDIDHLTDGDEFTHINGIEICSKYVSIRQYSKRLDKGKNNSKVDYTVKSKMFVKHWDTAHFNRGLLSIPTGQYLYIEEKEHGTSARLGHVNVAKQLSWYEKLLGKVGINVQKFEYKHIHGSRNITLSRHANPSLDKYRKDDTPTVRQILFNQVDGKLKKGEQIYCEITGYETNGGWIQKDFPYGCEPKEHRFMLYRVTQANEDGEVFDMSREYVYQRAGELGLEKPVLIEKYDYQCSPDDLREHINKLTNSQHFSHVDRKTIFEGVVVWYMDAFGKWTCLKNKAEEFLIKEGKLKDSADYVDMEEQEEDSE